jgi:hypothetical protein
MSQNTLLDKAIAKRAAIRAKKAVNREELDLAIACIEGSITYAQYGAVTGIKNPGAVQQRMVTVLRAAFSNRWFGFSTIAK